MNLVINNLGGNCPVQAEGTIEGFPFYFRSRGKRWSFSVANKDNKDPVDVCCGMDDGWSYEEKYGIWPEAGWITEEEALAFIYKAAQMFVDAQLIQTKYLP